VVVNISDHHPALSGEDRLAAQGLARSEGCVCKAIQSASGRLERSAALTQLSWEMNTAAIQTQAAVHSALRGQPLPRAPR
jgi:hypothetical protein